MQCDAFKCVRAIGRQPRPSHQWSKPSLTSKLQLAPEGRQEAQTCWPSAIAVGKLNLVEAPGKDPLVLDSTVCQVNPNCSLPEAVQLPTVSDVCFSFQPSDPHSMWMGASLDFKAATNR